MISSPADGWTDGRASPADRFGGNALVTTRPALIDGSCGVDKDFLSPFTYCHSSHRRDEGARECARTVRNATIHKEPISISLMTAWRHSSASSSSCFLPGCQKKASCKSTHNLTPIRSLPFLPAGRGWVIFGGKCGLEVGMDGGRRGRTSHLEEN